MTRDFDDETPLDTAIREAAHDMTSGTAPDLRFRVAARLAETHLRWGGMWRPALAAAVLAAAVGAWWVTDDGDPSGPANHAMPVASPSAATGQRLRPDPTPTRESAAHSQVTRRPPPAATRRVPSTATPDSFVTLPPLELEALEIEPIDVDPSPVEPIAFDAIPFEALSVEPLDSDISPDPTPRRR